MWEQYDVKLDKGCTWMFGTPSTLTKKMPFYLWEWGHFITLNGYFTTRKNYPQFLLFYTLSGQGKLTYDGREYILSKDTVAVIDCEKNHRYETAGDRWEYYWFHYSGTLAPYYYHLLNDGGGTYSEGSGNNGSLDCPLNIQKIKAAGIEAKIIGDIISNGSQYDLIKDLNISREITSLMTMLITKKVQNVQAEYPVITEKITNAISFMQEHLAERITLKQIADAVYVSKYHFSRVFKDQTGIPPYDFLTNLRISRAKELLAMTSVNLSEIAEKTGFTNSKSLIYNFKHLNHITPGEYRKFHVLRVAD